MKKKETKQIESFFEKMFNQITVRNLLFVHVPISLVI